MKNAKTFLEKRYNPDNSIEDAINIALSTLKEGYQGMHFRNLMRYSFVRN